jgi:uncharacterized damage-inducible protein DinB
METATTTLQPVIEAFKLQTRLFRNVTRDISEEHAKAHFGGCPNHIAWITGHLVATRYTLGAVLGLTDREPYPEFFESGKGIQDDIDYPSMDNLIAGWEDFAEKIIERLESLTEDELHADPPIQTPVGDNTLRGFITFICHHEAYHIGQLSILKRYFGYEPMSYA